MAIDFDDRCGSRMCVLKFHRHHARKAKISRVCPNKVIRRWRNKYLIPEELLTSAIGLLLPGLLISTERANQGGAIQFTQSLKFLLSFHGVEAAFLELIDLFDREGARAIESLRTFEADLRKGKTGKEYEEKGNETLHEATSFEGSAAEKLISDSDCLTISKMEPHPEKSGYIAKTGLWLILTVASVTMIGETKLMLDSQAVSQGKYWLLLSCHLVHSNLWHWLTNWGVFALLLSGMELKKDWGFFPFAGLLIGFSLSLILDSNYLYAGFSGILSGLHLRALHSRRGRPKRSFSRSCVSRAAEVPGGWS